MTSDESFEADVGRKMLRALDNRILKLTVLPTEKCNFRCTYCYEDFVRPACHARLSTGSRR